MLAAMVCWSMLISEAIFEAIETWTMEAMDVLRSCKLMVAGTIANAEARGWGSWGAVARAWAEVEDWASDSPIPFCLEQAL